MLIAVVDNNKRSKVQIRGQRGYCPKCESEVIAKCGKINIWHWAHKVKQECNWYSSESDWHREWKSLFPQEKIEVYLKHNRADAIDKTNRIWEFQNSYLSGDEIQERENAYECLVWIWHVKGKQKLVAFNDYTQDDCCEVRWYKSRYNKIIDEGSKKFIRDYDEANQFKRKMNKYGWIADINIINFIDFQDSPRYEAKYIYEEHKLNKGKFSWLNNTHALSENPKKPTWLPEIVEGLACRFWWQQSRSIQQCKKPIILDLGDNLFFAVSNVYTENILTFTDSDKRIYPQENASFTEGFLFEITKKNLIHAFENPVKPKQLNLL
jgi:hypothetical protein